MTQSERRCTKCSAPGPFNRHNGRPDGLQTWCKACMYESCKKSRVRGRTKISTRRSNNKRKQGQLDKLNEMKLSRGCADCGFKSAAAALQFDHVRGEKAFNIASVVGMSWDKLVTEIEKCDVVCANCHAIRTYERGYYCQLRPEVSPEQRQYLLRLHTHVREELRLIDDLVLFTPEQKARIVESIKHSMYVEATGWDTTIREIEESIATSQVTHDG